MTRFREIELLGDVLPPRDREAPLIQWLPLDQLVIDDIYQRPLTAKGRGVIRRMAGAFDWGLFSVLRVAPIEGGRFAVIDGQHRAHAALLAGVREVPCSVMRADAARQAAVFVAMNTTATRLDGTQIYRAALAAGDDWAVRADAAVAAAGCRLMTFKRSYFTRKRGEVYCVAAIRRFVEDGRDRAVTRALAALVAAGSDGPDCMGNPLKIWIDVVAVHPLVPDAVLADFLAEVDIAHLYDRCAACKRELAGQGTTVQADYRARLMAMLGSHLRRARGDDGAAGVAA